MACPTPNDVQAMSITESVLIPLLSPDTHDGSPRLRNMDDRIKAFNTPLVGMLCSACANDYTSTCVVEANQKIK